MIHELIAAAVAAAEFDHALHDFEQVTRTYRCDVDGQFYSDRTADRHRVCAMIAGERESGYRG